jgi:lactate dehydrogenase-like 2-hydroxyacid dehydrogenase
LSDYITLHLPLTESSRKIIDEAALPSMKETSILINTSRRTQRGANAGDPAAQMNLGHLYDQGFDVSFLLRF